MAKKKERGNGTGTVYPRKNKQGKIIGYLGAYYGPDGKRRYVSAAKKGECERKLRQAMTDADRGLIFDRADLKIGTYFDGWLKDVRDTVRQRTWERYESIVRVHIKPALGAAKLQALTPNHLRALYRDKLEAGLAPRTVNYIHVTMHKALKDAVSDGLVPKNVAAAVRSPRPEKTRNTPPYPRAGAQATRRCQQARRQARGPVRRGPALRLEGRRTARVEVGGPEPRCRDARCAAHAL